MVTSEPGFLGSIVVLGLVIWLAGRWKRARMVSAAGLLVTLVAGFCLYVSLTPIAQTRVPVAVGLFVGTAVLFRLLSTFEQ